jgi:hypothetical protein
MRNATMRKRQNFSNNTVFHASIVMVLSVLLVLELRSPGWLLLSVARSTVEGVVV